MAVTELENVANQIREVWSDLFMDELRESHVLVNLIDKTYDAEFNNSNDRARISQYDAQTGQLLDIDRVAANDNACDFTPAAQTMSNVDLIIDKRAVSSREFCDTVALLSQVKPDSDKLRQTMAYEVGEQINNHLYSLVSPSTSAPDHVLGGTATMSASVLTQLTQLADEAFWPEGERWLLVDPQYHKDLLDSTTLVSSDFVGDRPVVAGRIVTERYGWKIVMDNSAGLRSINTTPGNAGVAIAFIPEFMHWASPRSQFKMSDTHSSLKFGSVMSADTIFGAVQGISGDEKVIQVKTGA